jgi:4-hydroxybenzoate polyprenyltransferase
MIPLSFIFAINATVTSVISPFRIVLAGTLLFLFLFHLRIFDEFKDIVHDAKNYPDRPVPSGLITLNQLKKIGFVIIIMEFLIVITAGTQTTLIFIFCFGYSLLMLREFYVREFLRKHFTLYVFLHELLAIPLMLCLASFNEVDVFNTQTFLTALFLSFSMFLLEIGRKIRSPKDEASPADSYTGNYGITGAGLLIIVICLIMILLKQIIMIQKFLIIDIVAFVSVVVAIFVFNKNPSRNFAKMVFVAVILSMILYNLTFFLNFTK